MVLKVKNKEALLNNLQKEYMYALLRSIIYPREQDKKYWGVRVLNKKREKIIKESKRIDQPLTIFTSKKIWNYFFSKIEPKQGIPNHLKEEDLFNYFSIGSELNYYKNGFENPPILVKVVSNEKTKLLYKGLLIVKEISSSKILMAKAMFFTRKLDVKNLEYKM